MPRKINETTKDALINVPLPQHGASYTVISHKSIMDYALAEIAAQGYIVVDEHYRSTHDGQIAQGIYKLNYGQDQELSMMFAWSNSYNKQVRFKCVVGGYVNSNQTVMITGDMGNYARKHTGNADQETIDNMKDQLSNAAMYYDTLYNAKEAMKKITLSSRQKAELLGVLFAEYNILTTEQASIIRQQMDKPSFFYAGGADSLWTFYNHATLALKQSHPRTWLEDQRLLHWFMEAEFDLSNAINNVSEDLTEEITPVITMADPLDSNYGQPENQTNLLTQIAEITGDESSLIAQHPVTEEQAFIPEETSLDLSDLAGEYEVEEIPEVLQMIEEKIDSVEYTDPAGNTFEAPIVDETFTEDLEEKINNKITPCQAHDLEEDNELENEEFEVDFASNSDEEEEDEFSFDF